MASMLPDKDGPLIDICRQEKIRKCRSSYDLLTPLPFGSSQKRARAWSPVRFDGNRKETPKEGTPSEPVEPKKDTWSKYSINVPWRMVKARSSYDIGPPTTIPLAVVAPLKNSGFATSDLKTQVILTQSNRLKMTDTSFADRLKKPASEDSLTKSVLSSEVKEASDILSKAIKKRGKYATAANCAKSGNFLGGIFNKGKKQSITEQPKDIQQKSALVNADSSNSCKAVNELKRVEILPKNIEKNDKQIHSTNEAVQDGVLIKTFQKEIPAVPETRGRPSVGRISSRAPSNIVSDVVSKENSISGRPTSFRQSFPSASKEGKPKFENWFKEVQEASKSPVREKPVWAREKTSPLHSHIQKTRSFYDEISSSPARQQGKQSVEVRKSRGYVFDKQSGNSCPKDAAQSERSPNPPPGCLQPKNHHVSCSDIPSSPHLSLPSTVKNPINRVASMSTVSSPSAPRTASLSSFVSPVLSFVSSPHVAPINSPPCSPRSVSRSVTPIPSASVSTEVTLRLPFQTPFANIRTVDVFGSVVIPAHKLEEGEMSSSSSSSSPSTSSSETAHEDSAHGGQERSAPVGGLMDEGGFVNPVPPPRPLHFTSPLDVIENARKVRSLPGFYKSPTSPPQSFREAFAYAYQSHPLPIPFSENVHNDSKERHTEKPPEEKKSRSILGGIFRRRKKGSSSSLSSSSENESDTPKKTFFARRIKKRESQSRKKEKDKDKEDGEEPKVVKSPAKDGVNLPVTPYSYGRQTTYLITTDTGKVLKMSPTGSLGREVSKSYNFDVQPLGIPKTPLSRTGVSASHDSLPESAYGSINSSLQSSRLGRSSSTDTISRKEKKEALKSRVERLRDRNKGSSSEDDDLASGSSVFGSGTSLNRSDSFHLHRSRSSRTERYLRRKSQELETLKVESEKDRRNREVVQARILEIQKSQRGRPKRKLPGENPDLQVQLYEKPKWSKHFVSKDASEVDPISSRGCSKFSGNQYIVKKISDAACWPKNPFESRVPPVAPVKLFSNINQNHRSVSYENHINKVASRPSPYKKLHCSNSFSLTPPAPPPRDRSSLVSPYDCHRPISFSFENLNQESYSRRTPHPPTRIDSSVSSLPPKFRETSQQLPPASPYRRSSSERHLNQKEYSSLPSRPTLPKAYSPSETAEVHLNSLPTTASSFSQFYCHSSPNTVQPYGKASTGKNLCIPNVAPSPSSDYSSYVSDNSIKIPQPSHFSGTDDLQDNTNILETTLPNTHSMRSIDGFRIGKEVNRTKSLPLPENAPTSLPVKSDRTDESDSSSHSSNRDPSLKQQIRPLSVVVEKSESGDKESPPLTSGQKPQPPKRSSSSITTYNRELLKQHLDLEKNKDDDSKSVDIDQKFREFFLKEKERLERSKCANFEEALIELETIYKSLNLNSDDIFDGAEERESSQGREGDQRDRSATPKPKKVRNPDRTLDDLHYRRVQSSNRNQPDRKNALQLTGSYLLISPTLGPPPLDPSVPLSQSFDPTIGKEPDIVYDDVTVKNAQRANLVKVIDPQPPFGIPLGPVTQGSRSDYMNAPVPRSISRQENYLNREPDTVTDDLAFRALRKDGVEVNKPVDYNVADLETLLEDSRRHANVSRSKSVPRSLMGAHSYAATPQKKIETQTPRRLKHNHKTKRYGGSFCESFKEALTDGESSSLPNSWRQSRSWVERANLSDGKWDNLDASTETLKAASQPDIRISLISESRYPPGKAGEAQNLDKIPFEPVTPTEANQTPVSDPSLKPYISSTPSVKGIYKPFDSGFNAKPKPFYRNQDTDVSDSKNEPVDLVKLDNLISSLSDSKSDKTFQQTSQSNELDNSYSGEPVFLRVKEAKQKIQNAILGSVSNNTKGNIIKRRFNDVDNSSSPPHTYSLPSPLILSPPTAVMSASITSKHFPSAICPERVIVEDSEEQVTNQVTAYEASTKKDIIPTMISSSESRNKRASSLPSNSSSLSALSEDRPRFPRLSLVSNWPSVSKESSPLEGPSPPQNKIIPAEKKYNEKQSLEPSVPVDTLKNEPLPLVEVPTDNDASPITSSSEIVEDRRSPTSKAQKGPSKVSTVSPQQNESEKRRRRLDYERQRLLNQEKKRSPEGEEKERRKFSSSSSVRKDQQTQQRRSFGPVLTSEVNAIKREPVKKQALKKPSSLAQSQPISRRTPPRRVARDEPSANHNGHLHHKSDSTTVVKSSVEKELESEQLSSSSAIEMVQERRGSFPDKMSPLKPIRTPLESGDEKAEQEKRDRIQRYKEERRKQMAARYGTNDVSSSDEENTHSSSLGGLYKRRRRPRSGLGPTSDAQNIDGKRLQSSSLEHLKKSHENITSESLSHLRSEPPSAKESLEQSFTSTSTTGTANNNEIHSLKDEAHFAYNQETTSEPSAQRRSPQEGGRVDSADSTLSGSEGRVGGRRRTSGDEKDKSHKRKSHLNRASTSEEAVYPPGGGPISQLSDSNEEIPRRRRRRTPQGASDSSYTSSPSNTTPDATSRLTPSALAPSDLPGFSVTKGALPPVTPFSSFRNSQGSFSSTLNSRFKESDGALYQEPSKNLQHAKGTQQKTPPLKLGPLRKPEIPDVLRHRESNPAVGSPGVVPANISRPSSVVIEKPPLGLEGNSNIRSSAHRSSVKKSGDASLCFMASRRERKEEEAFPRNGVRSDSPDDVREHLDSLTSQAHDLKSRAETLTGENVFQECEEYLQVNKGFSISRSPSSPPPERRRSEESDESPTEASYPQNDTGVISDSGQKNRPGGPEGSCEGFGRMVLEEKVREGLSGSALSSGSPHLVDNAIIGRKNSLAFRREEDGLERASQGILKRVSLDLQDGDPRPILKKKSSVDEESLSDPKKSILKKKSLTDDELDSDRPRSILKSARSREDLMDRNDIIPSPPTPILKRGSKDHSEMEGGELRPILKRRDTTDGVKAFVGTTLVRRDSAPLPTIHPSHGILKKRPSSPSLEFGASTGERPLSVAERVAGMEAMQSESPVGGAKPKIRSRPSSRERPSSPSLLDREARRSSWVSPPPTPVGHHAFVEPGVLHPQPSDSFGTPPPMFGQAAASRVSQKAAFFAQLEHEMNSSSVPSPVTSPQGKKDRGTRFATQPVTEGEVNKASQMFESPSGRRSPRELTRSPEAGKTFSTNQGSESVVMRRMSGDPVLILPRRLSAQELRYEEGYGQEHVRGILKSDPGREKHKENPKSILKVDSRKSSFSEGEHPKGILKSESPMSSNKGSPEHDARSLKSVLKKDSSSEESKEIKSILKPESQSFDPEISSDSSSDVTTQDLSSSFSAGDTIVQAVNPFLVDSFSSCVPPLGSPVPGNASVEVEYVVRRSSSVNQQVMEEAVKQALPMKTKDNLAEALRQIEPIRDKSREREKEDHKSVTKEDVISNIREKTTKKTEEGKEKKEDRSRPTSKVMEKKPKSKITDEGEDDTEIAEIKASFEEHMKSLCGLGQDFRSCSKEVTFRHRSTQQKVVTHQDRWTVNDFSSCTKMESPALRNSSLESSPTLATSSSSVGLTKTPQNECVPDAAPSSAGVGSSINARLQSLQKHGEEGWKNRVQKDDDALLSPQPSRSKARPASLMERVSLLETSSEQWRDRVTQSDATKFTVAHKMASASSVPSLTPLGERKTTSSSVSIYSSTSVAISETMLSSPASERKKRSPQPKVFKSKTGSCLPELLSKGIAQSSPIFEAKKGSKDFSRSISIPSEVSNEPDADENSSTVVSIPRPDDEHFESFFASTSVKGVNNADDAQFDTADFDVISSSSSKLTVQRREVRLTRKNQGKRNPLRALAQRTDIKDEYTEFSLGVGERELRRMKVEELSKSSSLAMEALAGLASKENFSSVALKKVEDTPVQRELAPYSELMLIHIKGRRHPQVRLVAPFCSSVNQGDDFLLVTPFELFHYKGRYSNVIERAVASEMALYILQTKDLGVTSALKVTDVEEGSAAGKRERFWKKLGGTVNSEGLPPGLPDADDHIEAALIASNKIFEVKDQALVPLEEAWGQSPKYELLSSDKVLVFDFGSELYLWSGKRAPLVEKKKGTALLKELWKEKYDYSDCDVNPIFPPVDLGHMTDVVGLRPSWCICAKITENVETILFKEKFLDWPDTAQQHRIKEVRVEEEQKPEPVCELKLCDVESMINTRPEEPDLVLEMSHLGRGVTYYDEEERRMLNVTTNDIKVWHISENEKNELDRTSASQFFSEETYVVRWYYHVTATGRTLKGTPSRHNVTGRSRVAYFFWQGSHSSLSDKGVSALMTVELDEERGPHVRVSMGSEPPAFLNLFKGALVVFRGKRENLEDVSTRKLFLVRGEYPSEANLLEIEFSPSHLRSRSCVIVVTSDAVYLWIGSKVPSHTKEVGQTAVKHLCEALRRRRSSLEIKEELEGYESRQFCESFGRDSRLTRHYFSVSKDMSSSYDWTTRIWKLNASSGTFDATELFSSYRAIDKVCPFPIWQDELYDAPQPALFLVDAGSKIYIWQGWVPEDSPEEESVSSVTGSTFLRFTFARRAALQTAIAFATKKEKLIKSKQLNNGTFSISECAFILSPKLVIAGMESLEFQNLFPFWRPRDDVTKIQEKEGRWKNGEELCAIDTLRQLTKERYTLEELQMGPLPDGVDPSRLEKYLSDEDFKNTLGVSKREFLTLPAWKQLELKKKGNLF